MARVLTMLILLWTGVDLLNPSVCAIDQSSPRSSQQASMVRTSGPSVPVTPLPASEDCFCCCQHLVASTAWVLNPHVGAVQPVFSAPAEHVRTIGIPVDRPPQLA